MSRSTIIAISESIQRYYSSLKEYEQRVCATRALLVAASGLATS